MCLPLVILAATLAPPAPGLEARPMAAEALGLSMHLPAGAVATCQTSDEGVSYAVSAADQAWSMRINTLVPAVAEPTAAALIEEHLAAVRETGRPFRVLVNEPRLAGGVSGHLVFIEQRLDDDRTLVNGWLVLPTSPETFLLITVLSTADGFARSRPLLEASFRTIRLRTREELAAQRIERLDRARRFIDTLTSQRLRSMAGPRLWFRIYRPGSAGQGGEDTEVGFLSIHCLEARRGELTPERSASSFGAMEAEQGLMVVIEARAIISADQGQYLDVDGRYWMAWDRTTEAWSVRQTFRAGEVSRTSAETGVRNLVSLDVINSSKEQLTREPSRWTIPDKAYLSQPEIFLLGRLLPHDGTLSGEMLFYYYDSKSRRLSQRVDTWARDAATGHWVLTTVPLTEVAAVTQRFDAAGDRVERIDGDGTLTRRIDPRQLQRLWRSKDLLPR